MIGAGAIGELAVSGSPTYTTGAPPAVKVFIAALLNRKVIMAQRGVAMTVEFLAWDTTNNAPKTGDAANITLRWVKDGTSAALTTTTVTEVDATNCPGLYKCDLSASETDCKMGTLHGKSSTATIYCMPVEVGFVFTPTAAITVTGGTIKVDVDTIKTNPVVNAGTVTFPTNATLASTTNITAGTITTVTTVTNQLSAAQIATGVWTDITAGDFTVAASVGKSIMNGVALGTGLTVAAVSGAVGSVTGAVGSVTGAVGSVTGNVGGNVTGSVGSVVGLTAANLDVAVSTRMATYTQPTGFLAATFPGGTIANTTNITAGTLTTVANLTNLPAITANWLTAAGMAADASEEIADTLLGRNVSGGSSAGRTVKQALHFIRNKWTVAAGTLTVYDTDDSTTSWTSAVTGTAGADPITGTDPT